MLIFIFNIFANSIIFTADNELDLIKTLEQLIERDYLESLVNRAEEGINLSHVEIDEVFTASTIRHFLAIDLPKHDIKTASIKLSSTEIFPENILISIQTFEENIDKTVFYLYRREHRPLENILDRTKSKGGVYPNPFTIWRENSVLGTY